jgi:ubiquinol-cytochrome c reductase cytochrome c1 subunit
MAWYLHQFGLPSFLPQASANTAGEDGLHAAAYPWEHKGPFETYNHASIRRGYQGTWGSDDNRHSRADE